MQQSWKCISKKILAGLAICSLSAFSAEAPVGSPSEIPEEEGAKLESLKGQVKGFIVWSTSRSNSKHDVWMMNADGTDKKQLTNSDAVDWFPRISPDAKTIVFTRSKSGWVPETDAKFNNKWDVWTLNLETKEEKKVAENATWGNWALKGTAITFARGDKAYLKTLATGEETLLLDGSASLKKGTIVQEPNLSPDGKYLAATLRGTKRETGIWNIEKKKWNSSGAGCQIDWYSDGNKIYRMNPTGNGGSAAPSEVIHFKVKDGVQKGKVGFLGPPKSSKLMDLPGRRSHEYFPKLSQDDKYLVWCATDKGHDHDIYDYEVYFWKVGDPIKNAVRLTFHSGNDRWPDIFIQN